MSDIVYSIVKDRNIQAALQASARSTSAQRSVNTNDNTVWEQTVVAVMETIKPEQYVVGTDKENVKEVVKTVKDIVAADILANTVIPEEGKNREGKTFKVCDKNGVPKWSSWDQTRRIWAYCGEIGKFLAYGLAEDLYPESMKVAPKDAISLLCKKEPEGTIAGIDRCADQLQNYLDKVDTGDEVSHAHNRVAALMVNNLEPMDEIRGLVTKIDHLLSVVPEEDRPAMLQEISRLARHFNK